MAASLLLARWRERLPSRCAVCASWPSRPVCEACVARFAPPVPRCRSCALPVAEGVAHCGDCMRHAPPLDVCLACCDYAWPWAGQIGRFKFSGEAGWAGPMATLMLSTPWVEPTLEQADIVLPMPLAPARLRGRGFNQALELARRLAPGKVDAGLLVRTRETTAQSGLPRAQRLSNLKGAFALEPARAEEVRSRRVVLVDDVMTSGASLFTAARVLREAGAAHVAAIVFARTDKPGTTG